MPNVVELKLPKLHTGQELVAHSQARFNVLACGRRWGKSTFGLDRAVQRILQGKSVGWFSPTVKMMGESWRDCMALLSPIASKINQQDHRIECITGATIEFWSLDSKDSARGRKYHEVIIDEAAMVKGLSYVWSAVIRPTLVDYAGGAWFLSTPRGAGFFRTIFDRGQDPLDKDWASWQMPTISNPYIPGQEVEEARNGTPARIFAQEYEAIFDNEQGSVFRNFENCIVKTDSVIVQREDLYPPANVTPTGAAVVTINGISVDSRTLSPLPTAAAAVGNSLSPTSPPTHTQTQTTGAVAAKNISIERYATPYKGRFVMGIDWAQTEDFTVLTVIDADTHQVVDIGRFNQLSWTIMRERTLEMWQKWGAQLVVSEHNSVGGPNEEELLKAGVPILSFITLPTTKPQLIESLALAFEQQDVYIPDDPVLLGELRAYERKVSPTTGRSQYSAPSGSHDDMVMSLALAFHGVSNYRTPLFDFL